MNHGLLGWHVPERVLFVKGGIRANDGVRSTGTNRHGVDISLRRNDSSSWNISRFSINKIILVGSSSIVNGLFLEAIAPLFALRQHLNTSLRGYARSKAIVEPCGPAPNFLLRPSRRRPPSHSDKRSPDHPGRTASLRAISDRLGDARTSSEKKQDGSMQPISSSPRFLPLLDFFCVSFVFFENASITINVYLD